MLIPTKTILAWGCVKNRKGKSEKSKNDSFHGNESELLYILSRFLTERHILFRKVCLVHRLLTSGKGNQDNEQNNWN